MDHTFRVATFNTFNLVLPGQPFYQEAPYTQQAYLHKLSWSREQLYRMMSDVVVFQEVFHRQAVEELCDGIYPTIIAPRTEENQPRIAIATHFEVEETRSFDWMEEGQPFRRPPLYVRCITPCGLSFGVLGVHLKSRRPLFDEEFPEARECLNDGLARSLALRSKEAQSIRRIALSLAAESPLIIAGDFNASFTAPTTQIISSHGAYSQEHQFKSASEVIAQQRSKDIAYTHIYWGRYEEIDLILCSEHFFRAKATIQLRHVQYFNDHLADRSIGQIPSVILPAPGSPFTESAQKLRSASDHGQVVACFEVNPDSANPLDTKKSD